MKKSYLSPEFDYIKFNLSTVICNGIVPSAETVVPGEEISDDDDDV